MFDIDWEDAPCDPTILTGPEPVPAFLIVPADNVRDVADYLRLRYQSFVAEQGLFASSDLDGVDEDPRTVVLIARASDGQVLGGVRIAPKTSEDLGWWAGSRLVVSPAARGSAGIGLALVRAACAYAESHGVLRFDSTVQERYFGLFVAAGWREAGRVELAGRPHVAMTWPIGRIQRLADTTKAVLGEILAPLRRGAHGLGGAGFLGDDGAPVPGSDVVAACDAILPSMVARDPAWAGWCSVLVNINDLTAMGAAPVGLLDAVAAPDRATLAEIVRGIADAASAWGVPVLGGHTQLGAPAALSVTALGRTPRPVPAGGGRVGDALRLTCDLGGRWRPGYTGAQWDSTSYRSAQELRQLARFVADAKPAAAKDVSMAGIVGTAGMLAEASGTGAVLEVAEIPRPQSARMGDWLTCFPGFAMLTAHRPGSEPSTNPQPATSAECGSLTAERGVVLRWPDGVTTRAVRNTITGIGPASGQGPDKQKEEAP